MAHRVIFISCSLDSCGRPRTPRPAPLPRLWPKRPVLGRPRSPCPARGWGGGGTLDRGRPKYSRS
eukprot:2924908-Pyramimonas_sp.AAC.1